MIRGQPHSCRTPRAANRLASIALPTGTRSLTYGPRGSLSAESRPSSIAVTTGYDGYARLTSYTRTGEASRAMVYNGLDQRVMLTRGGTTVRRFIQDGDGRILGGIADDGAADNMAPTAPPCSPNMSGC